MLPSRYPYPVPVLAFFGLLALLFSVPYFFTLAGDAQVHLTVAELFSYGSPFRFNPSLENELVVASTSPFWTLLLTAYYVLFGTAAPLWLKFTVVALWLGQTWLLLHVARAGWAWPTWLVWLLAGLWLTNATIVANSLGGLENILSAVQLLGLYALALRWYDQLTTRRWVILGAVAGWALLTRPDGGGLAIVLLAALWLVERPTRWEWSDPAWRRFLSRPVIAGITAVGVLAPWYIYQYQITGRLVTDSSVARLLTGRQGAILLFDAVYLHPKAILSLATAYLPLVVGGLVLVVSLGLMLMRRQAFTKTLWAQLTAVLLLGSGTFFFTFIVGAESFGRYYLPLFPFLFLVGLAGLQVLGQWLNQFHGRGQIILFTLATLFLVTSSTADFYRRVILGQFAHDHVLQIIYGPAAGQYFSTNLGDLLSAPAQRSVHTADLRLALGVPPDHPFSMAVTEVQLRYFLDETVVIHSLDGRTSHTILPYFDEQSGLPDFGAYLLDSRPDYVHVAQWCRVGGWLSRLQSSVMAENLLCQWEQQAKNQPIGQQWAWQGHTVTLVALDIVRLDWAD